MLNNLKIWSSIVPISAYLISIFRNFNPHGLCQRAVCHQVWDSCRSRRYPAPVTICSVWSSILCTVQQVKCLDYNGKNRYSEPDFVIKSLTYNIKFVWSRPVYSGQQMRLDLLNCLLWVIIHIFIHIFWSSQWCTDLQS